ncbi:MAG: flagellar basal body-associated FliL family protein [Balneolaceae bacterium]
MSDELQEKELENSPEEGENPAEQQEEGKKFSKVGKIFLVVVVIIAQGIAAFAVVKNNYADIREIMDSMNTKGGHYFQLENIIINPAESNGNRYLVLSLAIELDTQGDLSEIDQMRVEVLDTVNFLLVKKTTDELSDRDQREAIKQDLKDEINTIFNRSMVRNLYFTKYVIQ